MIKSVPRRIRNSSDMTIIFSSLIIFSLVLESKVWGALYKFGRVKKRRRGIQVDLIKFYLLNK